MFGYDVKKGLIPEHYRQNRRALVQAHPKVVENIRGRGAIHFAKGETSSYRRSDETVGRLLRSLINESKLCCDSPGKDRCEQCQETGIANPCNH